jgi:hypothetical protein
MQLPSQSAAQAVQVVSVGCVRVLEAAIGIEPMNKGFAVLLSLELQNIT